MDFSPDGELLGVLDADQKFCVWHVKENHRVQFNSHVQARYTCFIWLTVCTYPDLTHIPGKHTILAALGKVDGGVDLLSWYSGKVEHSLEVNGHTGEVKSMCLSNNIREIYTCGVDNRIVRWPLDRPEETRSWNTGTSVPTRIVSLTDDYFMVACEELLLWYLPEEESDSQFVCRLMAQSTDVNSMKVVERTDQGGVFVLTTATSNREIHLWNIDGLHNLRATLVMKYAANFVSCLVVENRLLVTAVAQSNGNASGNSVHLFVVDHMSRSREEIVKPRLSMALTTNAPIVAATTLNFGSDNRQSIFIGSGSPDMLCFEKIDCDLTDKGQIRNLDANALQRALLNRDEDLLRTVLFRSSVDVVNATLERLPTQLVSRFVEELTWLAARHIANGRAAGLWLKHFLRIRDNYLRTLRQNELCDTFGSLLGIIEHRNRSLATLTELSGRLNFLYGQTMRHPSDDQRVDDEYVYVNDDVNESIHSDTDELENSFARSIELYNRMF